MTNRMKAPLTKQEAGGVPKPPKGKRIVCAKCHKPGGTLVRVDDNVYVHQNKTMCKMFGG